MIKIEDKVKWTKGIPLGCARATLGMTVLGLCLLALPALAADETPATTYSPDFCEFAVKFPSEPYTIQRCDENDPKKCYTMVSYTKVFDLDATVNFRVICNPIGKDVYDAYDGEVMKAALRAMTRDSAVRTAETSYRKEDGYKQAGLVGEGQAGRQSTIYIAQMWIGRASAMTVEAESIGNAPVAADEMFSAILKSVHYLEPSEMRGKGVKTDDEDDKDKDEKEDKEKKEK